MSVFAVFAIFAGLAAIGVTILSITPLQAWWARVCDFPRIQFAVLGSLALVAWWVAAPEAEWMDALWLPFGIALISSIAWQWFRVARYSPIWPVQFSRARKLVDEDQIKLLFSNVYMENRDVSKVIAYIRKVDPDVILLLEPDDWWDEQLLTLADEYPYSIRQPQDDTYGLVFYSRLELIDPIVRFIRRDHIPSIRAGIRLRSDTVIQFYGIHPEPPAPEFATDTKQRDAELVTVAKEIDESPTQPTIVGGDLNDVAWSDTTKLFQNISRLLDPRVGRTQMSTFPANLPTLRFPLDHVFCSRHFQLVHFARGPNVGSDHLPVFIHVQYAPTDAALNEVVEQQPEDREEAEAKLTEANRSL